MKNIIEYIIGSIISFITLMCIVVPDFAFFKQLSEYTIHIMFTTVFIGLVSLIFNRGKLMTVSFLCTAFLALFLKNASNLELRYPDKNTHENIEIAHFNLSNLDHNLDNVVKTIKETDPDIITFQEYTPEWTNILNEKIKNKFKFSWSEVRIDPFGAIVFSKHPIKKSDLFFYNKIPNLNFQVELNQKKINLVLSYVLPPILNQIDQNTRDHLNHIGDFILNHPSPTILIGDFNMVYWSNEITSFRQKYNLRNSRKNYTPNGLSIPYDHMFYTTQIECSSLKDLNNMNGDHVGISGVFQLPLQKNAIKSNYTNIKDQ